MRVGSFCSHFLARVPQIMELNGSVSVEESLRGSLGHLPAHPTPSFLLKTWHQSSTSAVHPIKTTSWLHKSAYVCCVFCPPKHFWNVSLPAGTQCLKPVVQEVLTISPFQRLYRIGESIELTCPKGFVVAGPSRYTCSGDSWTPPISSSITCEKGEWHSGF